MEAPYPFFCFLIFAKEKLYESTYIWHAARREFYFSIQIVDGINDFVQTQATNKFSFIRETWSFTKYSCYGKSENVRSDRLPTLVYTEQLYARFIMYRRYLFL